MKSGLTFCVMPGRMVAEWRIAMQRRQGRFSRTRLILLTSSVITLISQVYFNAFSDQFRLSLSVVPLPLSCCASCSLSTGITSIKAASDARSDTL